MEMGLGFVVGLLAGGVVVAIVAVILAASRKAVGATRIKARAAEPEPLLQARAPGASTETGEYRRKTDIRPEGPQRRSSNTIVVDEMEVRDSQLNKNIQEVRDLLLRLADVISTTGDASGRAAVTFNSVKNAIDAIDLSRSDDLCDAQRALVGEIDRVLKTNAALHTELEKANRGIAEQRRQIEELRVQARIDGLTRIPNRAAFDERMQEYVALLQRTSLVFTLFLMDIDYFKRVNDEHGHLNGDRILRGVAAKITDSIRTNDFAARYGGEEFAVILPGTGLEEARQVAERVRQDIAKTNFRLDNQVVKMTVSGGLAECGKGMGCDNVLAAADRALYRAKEGGRNRIVADGDGE